MKDDTIEKVTLNLRKGDYAKVGDLFPDLRAGPAIRQIISAFIDRAEAAAQQGLPDADVQL
jgi:hypothetical protein